LLLARPVRLRGDASHLVPQDRQSDWQFGCQRAVDELPGRGQMRPLDE